ncbi:Reverse transcriptase RNA-dependent DNA polymerase [Penicillium fimorum]|uniref:Reverse transcriptase RNA-dependent DNA polymerase n=1 Tax=Penicillium fimorum TaxID=1882269 RepID=A0A9W9XRA1_9EURO|nr:Reverse transcriptase RNA-dependent DNA polymerase [Penicillium fimorum]
MADRHGASEPKFSDLVPNLKGESNWELWKKGMRIALNGKNLTYWGILTGLETRPTDLPGTPSDQSLGQEDEEDPIHPSTSSTSTSRAPSATAIRNRRKLQEEWDQKDAIILTYVASAMESSMKVYIQPGATSAQVFNELRELCEAKTFFLVSNKAIKWVGWKYKPGVKPEEFVTKWRQLFSEMQEAYPANQRVSPLFAIHMFMNAVSSNAAAQHWLNTVSIREDWSYDHNLHHLFGDFIASEGRRLGNASQQQSQPQQQASSNAASTDKKKKKDSKSKDSKEKKQIYCPFHKKHMGHKPTDCFLNPKNKKPESANTTTESKPTETTAAAAAAALVDNLWVSATYVNEPNAQPTGPRFLIRDDRGVTHDIHDLSPVNQVSRSQDQTQSVNSVSDVQTSMSANRTADVSLHDGPNPNKWMLDSGCSAHMTPCRSVFHTFTAQRLPIHSATGETFYAEGYGEVVLDLADYEYEEAELDERIRLGGILLKKVWYAPSLKHSLISVKDLTDAGTVAITCYKNRAELKSVSTGEIKGYATVENNQYWLYTYNGAHVSQLRSLLDANSITRSAFSRGFENVSAAGVKTAISMDLAHRRACHAGEARVRKTATCAEGLSIKKSALTRPCGPCVIGKGHALPFGKNKSIRTAPGDLIHTDVWGPISISSISGYNYYVTFTDDASRFCWVFLLKHRSEVLDKFIQVEQWLKTQLNLTVKRVSGDNAKEHEPLREYLISKGAVWDPVPPYTPRLNGIPEIKNKHLLEPLVAIMSDNELPKYLWGPLIQGINYTQNRLWHSKIECTPFEKLHGYQPDISHLRALGCQCWYMIAKERRQTKLHPHSAEGRFLGYDQRGHYQIYDVSTKKIVISKDVVFNETPAVSIPTVTDDLDAGKQFSHSADSRYVPLDFITPFTPDSYEPIGYDNGVEAQRKVNQQPTEESQSSPPLRRSTRIKKPSRAMLEHLAAHSTTMDPAATAVFASEINDAIALVFEAARNDEPVETPKLTPADVGYIPNGWVDAMNCAEKEKWLNAAHIELRAHIKNGTWRVVDRKSNHTGRKPITLRWVFDIKKDDGRYKARLVARGFNQTAGVDFHEVYAVVAKPMSFKVFCAIAAALDWRLHHLDIKTAFLNADIKEAIHIELPENQVAAGGGDKPQSDKIGLLMKTIYGLKQSPREWYIMLHDALISIGFTKIHADHSIFVKWLDKGTLPIYVLVYVDDILVLTPSEKAFFAFKKQLSKHFDLTDKGIVKEYLGIEIIYDTKNGAIGLSQKKFITTLLHQYGMLNCKPASTPFNEKNVLTPSTKTASVSECKLYQEKVGKAIWLMMGTRGDIAFAATQLAKHARNPGPQHEQAIKHLFRYLLGSIDLCIWFSADGKPLSGYCDADHVGPHSINGISTSGFVFHLAGGPISWASKKQACVALSSTESEYIAQALAVQEARWLILLLTELRMNDHQYGLLQKPVVIQADNTGAIALAKNPEYHARTKHIAVRYHFLRQEVSAGNVIFEYVTTQLQAADGFTKPLAATAFRRFINQLGLRPIN